MGGIQVITIRHHTSCCKVYLNFICENLHELKWPPYHISSDLLNKLEILLIKIWFVWLLSMMPICVGFINLKHRTRCLIDTVSSCIHEMGIPRYSFLSSCFDMHGPRHNGTFQDASLFNDCILKEGLVLFARHLYWTKGFKYQMICYWIENLMFA